MENKEVLEITELTTSACEYLGRAIPAIERLADHFYHEVTEAEWHQLSDMSEGIEWLILFLQHAKSFPELIQEIEERCILLNQAVEARDYVLIGDYLLYEFVPLFQKIYDLLLEKEDFEQ